jgi:chitin disaccharide deacetylase
MKPNPSLKKLGFSNTDRLLIIHADDIGMCYASLQAYIDLMEFGGISSAAAMVPCPWFPHLASYSRENKNADIGIHLTLTSEWETYRWSPVSTHDPASGMIDSEGYFFRTAEEVQLLGDIEAVNLELFKQVERALTAGINITHLDTHMFSVAHPKFIHKYIQLAVQQKLPFLFPRMDNAGYQNLGMDQEIASIAALLINELDEMGIPLVDNVVGLDLNNSENRINQAKQALNTLPSGITHFIIHPSIDTPELRAIAPDWQSRVADYHTFMNDEIRVLISDIGIHVIGYELLKKLWLSR